MAEAVIFALENQLADNLYNIGSWKAKIELEEEIKNVYQWFLENMDAIKEVNCNQ
jgi:dTDP-D-glucose 4,6-dehydratase